LLPKRGTGNRARGLREATLWDQRVKRLVIEEVARRRQGRKGRQAATRRYRRLLRQRLLQSPGVDEIRAKACPRVAAVTRIIVRQVTGVAETGRRLRQDLEGVGRRFLEGRAAVGLDKLSLAVSQTTGRQPQSHTDCDSCQCQLHRINPF